MNLTDGIKRDIDAYFKKLNDNGISDDLFFDSMMNPISGSQYLLQILSFPIAILGFIHCSLFYFPIRHFVEKKFRRDVFWGSTKLIMMIFIAGPVNLLVLLFLPPLMGWPLSVLYFLGIPFFGFIFHNSLTFWLRLFKIHKVKGQNLIKLQAERAVLKQNLDNFVELKN